MKMTMASASSHPGNNSSGSSYFATLHGGSPRSPSSSSGGAIAMISPSSHAASEEQSDDITNMNNNDTTNMNNNADQHNNNNNMTDVHNSTSALNSTPYLQSRLLQLRTQSQDVSTELTKKLATSRSGQSLLHIGPSLSTLPPDLTSLLDALSPLVAEVEQYEKEKRAELERLVGMGREVQCARKRREFGVQCAEMYKDLRGAEEVVLRWKMNENDDGATHRNVADVDNHNGDDDEDWSDDEAEEELDHVCSLERAAYTTLYLLQELQTSSAEVTAMTTTATTTPIKKKSIIRDENNNYGSDNTSSIPNIHGNNTANLPSLLSGDFSSSDNNAASNGVILEKSRFLAKLAPRIRRLESDTAKCLVSTLEDLLVRMRSLMEEDGTDDNTIISGDTNPTNAAAAAAAVQQERKKQHDDLLLMIGNCLRGLALLGKGADAENAFARVAIMPIIRSKLSMGKLDEGGSRGECAGLFFLLDGIATSISTMYGSILRSSEGMFGNIGGNNNDKGSLLAKKMMEVDLVTCGVWVPVATALMADPGIKMAIFSPGIANVLQANYSALDTFLSELAGSLLRRQSSQISQGGANGEEEKSNIESGDFSHLYYQPDIKSDTIELAQARLYAHPTTVEFSKRWNLPIYYQLRFAEFCKRLDKAVERVCREGWTADVFTGDAKDGKKIADTFGFELPFFFELYDILLSMWKPDVYLRPLTHRFLRGAMQLIGRVLAFVREGADGNIEFGGEDQPDQETELTADSSENTLVTPAYFWNERVEDVAVVSWELTILETCLTHDYLDSVASTVCPQDKESRESTHNSSGELEEIRSLASEVLVECSQEFSPLVTHCWNKLIVDRLTKQCCIPLTAVKGVAATYRMTNRPPPTQASPFVASILRPLKSFNTTFSSRTPPQIGDEWKQQIVSSVSAKYSIAVEDLIATVKRTEEALKSRKTRKLMAGGMSDGEKVKLQLLLDYRQYKTDVEELGLQSDSIEGLVKLNKLTAEAESLLSK